jgi:hypothetical protein
MLSSIEVCLERLKPPAFINSPWGCQGWSMGSLRQ